MPVRAATAASLLLAASAPVHAADLTPGKAALGRAVREGAGIARRGEGYHLGRYVIYAVRDARAIDPADGAVDAVAVATPFERARHAAYLDAREGKPFERPQIEPPVLGFNVFAHGKDEDDVAFARSFSAAELQFDSGQTVFADAQPSETSEAVYPLARENRERQVATVSYRFPIGDVSNAGQRRARLRFVDSSGKAFDLAFDLARLR